MEKWRKTWSMYKSISSHIFWKKSFFFNFPFERMDWIYLLCYLCLQESFFKNFRILHCIFNESKYVFFQKEYCFINNTCVQLAAVNPENRCQECNPGRNNYRWSGIQGILNWKLNISWVILSDISVSTWTQIFLLKWIYDI